MGSELPIVLKDRGLLAGETLKWKRNVKFAKKSIRHSMIRESIAVTLAPEKPIGQNRGASTNSFCMVANTAYTRFRLYVSYIESGSTTTLHPE